ncbi:Hsp70 family protein [Kitasatospora griseola]|uniref:Hsp70 family protein n=1 Tax=Kitasatospora griseola TaxID=2064 RepID=UPI0038557729
MYGVDLGDSYARIAWLDHDGRPVTADPPPDAPAVPATVRGTPGTELRVSRAPGAVSARDRLLRRTAGSAAAAAALVGCVLAELARHVTAAGREAPHRVVLGRPTGGEPELRRAAEAAGLRVEQVLPEAVAAALHYGTVREGVRGSVLVHDQGATGLRLSLLSVDGDERSVSVLETVHRPLGGDHWDQRVEAELRRSLTAADHAPDGALRRTAEHLRLALDTADHARRTIRWGGTDRTVELDRQTLDALVRPLREQSAAAVGDLLDRIQERGWEPPDTVLLAGGLGAAPGARESLEQLGLLVRSDAPQAAVASGLALAPTVGMLWVQEGPQAAPPRRTPRAPGAGPVDPEPRSSEPPVDDPEPPSAVRPPSADPATEPEPEAVPVPPEPAPPTGPDESPAGPDTPPAEAEPEPARPEPEPEQTWPDPPAGRGPEPGPGQDAPPPEGTPPPAWDRGPVAPEQPPPGAAGEHPVPVGQLDGLRRDEHLLVRWVWPDGAQQAQVEWRLDGEPPAGVARSGELRCSRRGYHHDGGLTLPVGRGAVVVTVWALAPYPADPLAEPAVLDLPARPPLVRYDVLVPRLRPLAARRGWTARLVVSSATGCLLPPLQVVHGLGRARPTRAGEGAVLHELAEQRLAAGVPLTVKVAVPPTDGPSWLVCLAPADTVDLRPISLHRLRVT